VIAVDMAPGVWVSGSGMKLTRMESAGSPPTVTVPVTVPNSTPELHPTMKTQTANAPRRARIGRFRIDISMIACNESLNGPGISNEL